MTKESRLKGDIGYLISVFFFNSTSFTSYQIMAIKSYLSIDAAPRE